MTDAPKAALSASPVGEPLRRIVLDTLNAVATAVENLSVHQEQCDRDGVMVKVSRQALDEVLNAVNEVAMQSAITASPAAPVAQEPVAWRWRYKTVPDMRWEVSSYKPSNTINILIVEPLYTSPPAALAGLGADEIARASNWKLVDGTMTTGESVIFDGSFIIAKVTRREDADLILALLSRGSGSDQTRRHEEQSTQSI